MNKLLGVVAVVAIALFFVMASVGPGSRTGNAWHYLTTGNTSQAPSGNPQAQAAAANDLHAMARQDAIDNHIDPDLFERQISAESSWNPNAVSPMGAIGIAQIMPSTAKGWNVNPWNATDSLSAAAKAMAWYYHQYNGDYSKALSAYNYGYVRTNSAISNCGDNWRGCVPAETQRYITAIMG